MMTREELHEACKLAGLQWDRYGYAAHCSFRREDGMRVTPIYELEDPALRDYVASLLVEQVYVREPELWESYDAALTTVMYGAEPLELLFATDEQRIRAAVTVLQKTGGNDDSQ